MRRKLIYIIIVLNIWYFDSALGHARIVFCSITLRGELYRLIVLMCAIWTRVCH